MNSSFFGTPAKSMSGGGQSSMAQNNPSLLPCNIEQITSAPPPEDGIFRIDGQETHSVSIVGRIVDVKSESIHTTYTIEDETGTIDFRMWKSAPSSSSSSSNKNDKKSNNNSYGMEEEDNDLDTSNMENDNKEKSKDKESSCNEYEKDTFVRCIGKIKKSNNNNNKDSDNRLITGFGMQKVTDMKEIKYHSLEAMYAHLVNTNPDAKRKLFMRDHKMENDNNTSMMSNNGTHNGAVGGGSGVMSSLTKNGRNDSMMLDEAGMGGDNDSELRRNILSFLRSCDNTNDSDGCPVDAIFSKLSRFDRNDIREMLEEMSTDGSIYTTVDDEHYRAA